MDFKIGDIVYKSFSPARVGVVEKIETKEWDFEYFKKTVPVLTVRLLNGKTWETPQGYCEDYRALIEDHRRKLLKHEAVLQKLTKAGRLRRGSQ